MTTAATSASIPTPAATVADTGIRGWLPAAALALALPAAVSGLLGSGFSGDPASVQLQRAAVPIIFWTLYVGCVWVLPMLSGAHGRGLVLFAALPTIAVWPAVGIIAVHIVWTQFGMGLATAIGFGPAPSPLNVPDGLGWRLAVVALLLSLHSRHLARSWALGRRQAKEAAQRRRDRAEAETARREAEELRVRQAEERQRHIDRALDLAAERLADRHLAADAGDRAAAVAVGGDADAELVAAISHRKRRQAEQANSRLQADNDRLQAELADADRQIRRLQRSRRSSGVLGGFLSGLGLGATYGILSRR